MKKVFKTAHQQVKDLVRQHEQTKWIRLLERDIKAVGIPTPEKEFRWHPTAGYRADYAWPEIRAMIEVDGGTWKYRHGGLSGHTTGKGYERDRIRDCEAMIHGWKVMRVTPSMVERGEAIKYIKAIFFGDKI
jgi:very-short-patch-repair endonuclease